MFGATDEKSCTSDEIYVICFLSTQQRLLIILFSILWYYKNIVTR